MGSMRTRRPAPGRRATCILLLGCTLIACQEERWSAGENIRAPDADVAAALGDTAHQNSAGLAASDIPEIDYPGALRPCCAFGADLKVALGAVPVPGVEIANLLGPADPGPHRYDNGYISLNRADARGIVDDENNGLIYTCRGGFIDLAHVRDNADNTLALSVAVARLMDSGGTIDVPPQGADMSVRLRALPKDAIARAGRVKLAVAMGQWLAYQFSIWHEITTFYGYASIAAWPEKISAFSPEDLYSNETGARLAGGIILGKGARSDEEYGVGMDAWIQRMLERLGAVSLADSQEAMRRLDGAWWDSEKRIPDWTLVKRRSFETGPYLHPWLLRDATPGAKGPVEPLDACKDAAPPLVYHIHEGFAGMAFDDYATVEFDLHDLLVENGFPIPSDGSRRVTHRDFPAIIASVRKANAETFGPGADAP